MTKLAVIYYSATGHGTTMAQHIANAGERAGAEVTRICQCHAILAIGDFYPGSIQSEFWAARWLVER